MRLLTRIGVQGASGDHGVASLRLLQGDRVEVDELEEFLELRGQLSFDVGYLAARNTLAQQRDDGLRPVNRLGVKPRGTRLAHL